MSTTDQPLIGFLRADEKRMQGDWNIQYSYEDGHAASSRIAEPLRALLRDYTQAVYALKLADFKLAGKRCFCGSWMVDALTRAELHKALLEEVNRE
jgi:hypothetical protein